MPEQTNTGADPAFIYHSFDFSFSGSLARNDALNIFRKKRDSLDHAIDSFLDSQACNCTDQKGARLYPETGTRDVARFTGRKQLDTDVYHTDSITLEAIEKYKRSRNRRRVYDYIIRPASQRNVVFPASRSVALESDP